MLNIQLYFRQNLVKKKGKKEFEFFCENCFHVVYFVCIPVLSSCLCVVVCQLSSHAVHLSLLFPPL